METDRNIQLICYTYISDKTPLYDMLSQFLSIYKCDPIYAEFFQTLLKIPLSFPVGYAIKQTALKEISFELYFYQLDPFRTNHLQMYVVPTFTRESLHQIDPFLTHTTWEEDVFILSLNIDEAYLTKKKKQVTYYFLTGPVYFYTHKVCSEDKTFFHSSDYSLAYVYPEVIQNYPEWYERACFYQSNQKDLFIGSKDYQERFGYYLQKISFERFLHFLEEFQYSPMFIEACKQHFNDTYVFDVGFDFWRDGTLAKTMLYGILQPAKSS